MQGVKRPKMWKELEHIGGGAICTRRGRNPSIPGCDTPISDSISLGDMGVLPNFLIQKNPV
ncbi:hypothetical protein N782_13885 [Pontibacillus yanchengensis Y32]|uniref:Uncharacterized protein n=1 Tax=Pontibacillus yanchengensis Y32 TaxID=1385514 RepID=A0A0A2T8J2_9BACI|nr:hypothetical protein N782_13885 [Pontibacillus yanchengensis Y32]